MGCIYKSYIITVDSLFAKPSKKIQRSEQEKKMLIRKSTFLPGAKNTTLGKLFNNTGG